ncbi:MAG: choice-of-anchor D domain-containing protein [Candidatus Eisenbacteria bacterium]|nr:choice-of-anchor D domain-containing protein [Candidatus Eisenbacteria bacterium]
MLTRKLPALLLLGAIAAIPFLGSCKSSTVTNPPVCATSPASLDFGTVSVGTTADRTITVKNTGGGTLSGTVSVACSQYSLVGSGSYGLGAGDSARFTVRFAPTAVGVKLCSVYTGCDSIHVTGTGAISATPVCTVSPATLTFPTVTVGQTSDLTFTITNVGGGTLTGTVTATGCPGFTVVGDASYSLATNQAKTVTVRYAPTGAGPQNCSINPGTGCSPVNATGTGQPAPACQVSTASLDFGSVTVGHTSDKIFSITNSGGGTLTGTVSLSECGGFSLVGDASYSLTASQSKTFTVRFAPTSEGEPAKAQFRERRGVRLLDARLQSCTVATGCGTINASGTGIAASACQVNPTSLAFGAVTVGQTSDKTFTLTNTGGGTLSGTVSTGGCAGFSIVGDATYSLSGSQSKTFTVRYAPTGAGAQNCNINAGAGCSSVGATGTGQLAPVCQVSTATLNFGSVTVGQTADRTFTITNTGGGTLTGTVATSGCSGFSVVGDATYSLGAGLNKIFTIRFAPTSAGKPVEPQFLKQLRRWIGRPQGSGVQSCTVTTGCSSVSATGTGVSAVVCAVLPTALNFGSVTVGQTSDRTFTITNNGGAAMSGTVSLSCANFSIVGSAAYNLSPGQAATITVRYAPTSVAVQNCTINVGGTCGSVAASGAGVASVTCQPTSGSSYFGTWLMVDSIYTCAGVLQTVYRDTVVFCENYPNGGGTPDSSPVGDSTFTMSCAVTKCTSSEFQEECSGAATNAGCTTTINLVIKETIAPNAISAVITTNVSYAGNCSGLQGYCTITGAHLTKISSDTTNCGRVSTGGGGSLTLSCKVNGVSWTGTGAGGTLVSAGGVNFLQLFADRASDASTLGLSINSASPITATTYTTLTGANADFTQGEAAYFGDESTQITITSLNSSAKTLAGTFQFNGVPGGAGSPVSITEGTFSGTYVSFGAPRIGSPRWIARRLLGSRR